MSVGVAFPTALREAILAKSEDQINQTLTDVKVRKCFLDWAERRVGCLQNSPFLISLYNIAWDGQQRSFSYEPIKLTMDMSQDMVEGYYEAGLLNSAQIVKVHQVLRTHQDVDIEKDISLSLLPSEDLVHLLSATKESGELFFEHCLETNCPLLVDVLREKCSSEQIVQLFSIVLSRRFISPMYRLFPTDKEKLLYPLLGEKCTAEQLIQLCSLRDEDNDPVIAYSDILKSIFPILKEKCTIEQLVDLFCLRDGNGMSDFFYDSMFGIIPDCEIIVLILDAIGTRMDAPEPTHKWLNDIFLQMKKLDKEEFLKFLKITGENGKSLLHIPYFFNKTSSLLQEMCTWRELFDLLSIQDKLGNTPVLIPDVSHQATALMEQEEQKLKEELSQLQTRKRKLEDHKNKFGIPLSVTLGLAKEPEPPSPTPSLKRLAYGQVMRSDVE